MRLGPAVSLVWGSALIALVTGACSVISGLSDFSTGSCSVDGCKDATTAPPRDAQAEGNVVASDDATSNDAPPGDDDGSPADDGASDATTSDDTGSEGDGGFDSGPAIPDAAIPCPDGGCPTSTAVTFSACPFGSCNGSTTTSCTAGGGCYCIKDSQCLSGKCVKITGQNDQSCGSGCSGSGSHDGFNCALGTPGIPAPTGTSTYSCASGSGYKSSTLTCDSTHTTCYCSADSECPSGKCINVHSQCTGTCTGSGTADYRGCQATAAIPGCPIYIGCPSSTTCNYPVCYCTSDSVCESGHCIPSSHNGNCSGCTGTGSDDGHGCQPPPSSVACTSTGSGSGCSTTLTPAPVLNSAHTSCVCVADSDCSSGKCVNSNSQCTGTCTGSGSADSEDCETATSTALTWACATGNCQNVTSPGGTCTAAGVPCWCTSDPECPDGTRCAQWAGCASGACTGSGTGNAFNCVE